jgi:hypothetical protein
LLVGFLQLSVSMNRTAALCTIALAGALWTGCAHLGAHNSHRYLTPAERLAAIRRARVWTKTDIPAVDIRKGPARRDGFPPGATVTCDYRPDALGGRTPKFACAVAPDDVVKVKYGKENGEVYAGVAATRLLWALGFGADAIYPVHVICRGCPKELAEPGGPAPPEAGDVRFDFATIERKMPGRQMETRQETGWAWPELDLVDPQAGGAPRAQRDALKLLAVLLQHSDNKADQQRLLCESATTSKHELADCEEPFMMLHDVGLTFGRANLFNRVLVGGVNLAEWRRQPIWRDAARCVGNLSPSQTGTLSNPRISEEGRKFLADLLVQLTDDQLRDLFEVARFDAKPPPMPNAAPATTDAWVAAFKQKRDEIVSARCPF